MVGFSRGVMKFMVLGFFSFNWKKLKYINSNGERTVYQLHPHKKERYKALRHYKN